MPPTPPLALPRRPPEVRRQRCRPTPVLHLLRHRGRAPRHHLRPPRDHVGRARECAASVAIADAGDECFRLEVRSEVEQLKLQLARLESFRENDSKSLDGKFDALEEDGEIVKAMGLDIQSLIKEQRNIKADVCHAYQILRRGGVKEENIVVFMYDDIAENILNPRPGVIINHPQGKDVYAGVPKDYTGDQVTTENFFAVLLGNKTAVTGGSRKVIDSKPKDHIFIYYSDHGGPGVLGMPNLPYLYAGDFIKVLQKKHASNSYSKMVIYVEACESGSIFEGLMSEDLNIYVTTASNAVENSWGTYCPGMDPSPPPEYITCLGDVYSVSWMEDSETHNLKKETIKDQYEVVKARTSNSNKLNTGSHVMEYGDKTFKDEKLFLYQGFDPSNANITNSLLWPDQEAAINQRDADILFMWKRYEQLNGGSEEKLMVLREIKGTMVHRKHLDSSIDFIGKLVFGFENGPSVLEAARGSDQPLVDDWDSLKRMVRIFESQCGSLTQYGMKHMRAFANICNNGVSEAKMREASIIACGGYDLARWSPRTQGHSA